MRILAAVLAAAALVPAAKGGAVDSGTAAERDLFVLSNDRVVVGIAPRLAGRIVVFRAPDGENLLDADPKWWSPDAKLPGLAAGWDYPAINGWVVWTGPQKEWWLHQDVSAEWKERAYNWPPDPWCEWAPYEIVSKTDSSVVLRGPASPVTGLTMTKRVSIQPDGRTSVKVTAANGRKERVRWDLWSNVRVRTTARVWVPVSGNLRIEHSAAADGKAAALDYEIREGWFRFLDDEPAPEGAEARVAKAFLTPSSGMMAAFVEGAAFIRSFAVTDTAKVAPDQGVVEVFRRADADAAKSLFELEVHGAYTELAPKEEMSMEEIWEVRKAPSGDAADEVAWLKGLKPAP